MQHGLLSQLNIVAFSENITLKTCEFITMNKEMKNKYTFAFALVIAVLYNGSTIAQQPDWLWAKSPDCFERNESFDCTADNNGNIVVTGFYNGSSITFDTTSLNQSGSVYLVKYDSIGNVLWARS